MRRPLLLVGALFSIGLLSAGVASAATPNDTECTSASGTGSTWNSERVKKYDACRFDKLDAAVKALGATTPAPSPSATSSPTPEVDAPVPTSAPTPTVTLTPTPTPSPTPTVTPTPSPSATPAAFPNASNTGVPAGTSLTAYSGPLTITTANTVIDSKTVNGGLVIKAAGVKITNSQINGTVSTDEESSGYSFLIADSTVNVGNKAGTGVGAVNFTANRVHVLGGNRSMNCWKDCTITDSYVHGQFTDNTGVTHESGIRMGARGVIRHNTIACTAPDVAPDAGCSAALTGYGDFATVENMTIDNNLFVAGSGGYCSYGGSTSGKPYPNAHDIKFTNNVWQRGTQKSDHGTYICGYYGPVTAFSTSAPGNVWSGNKFDDGSPVAPA